MPFFGVRPSGRLSVWTVAQFWYSFGFRRERPFRMAVTLDELEAFAQRIPEMGGRRIGPFLRDQARQTPPNTSIVELGCWLGAGTAQMALGLRERPEGHGVTIDCYDNFLISPASVQKAARQGVTFTEGQDSLPWVTQALEPFGPGITLHKGMLTSSVFWSGHPISLYVDDASKYPWTFYTCLKLFGPSWIPGQTVVVLMDYWLFKKAHNAHRVDTMRAQYDFITAHPEVFQPIAELTDNTCAAFRYRERLDFGAIPVPEPPRPSRTAKAARALRRLTRG